MLDLQLKKNLGTFSLDVSLRLASGELLVILGPSGCGKSTILNLIAGLQKPDEGHIRLGDRTFYGNSVNCPINKRGIAYIQQGGALFPHLTAGENIYYSVKRKERRGREGDFTELLRLLDLDGLEERYPHELSGGQQQRVAIGRALMTDPELILWDEPFSALDHRVRDEMRSLVRRLKERLRIPMIFVTHDLDEAFQLSDRLAVMDGGTFLQEGSRDRVFDSPRSVKTAQILGVSNILPAEMTEEGLYRTGSLSISSSAVPAAADRSSVSGTGDSLCLGIRPGHILYVRDDREAPRGENIFKGTILVIKKHIHAYQLTVEIAGLDQELIVSIPRAVIRRYELQEGDSIGLILKKRKLLVLHDDRKRPGVRRKAGGKPENAPASGAFTPPVIALSGVSNSGKTTVMVRVIEEMKRRGYKVGTIKHDGHGFEMDREGKDTHRHRMAGAEGVIIASRNQYAMIRRTDEREAGLEQLIGLHRGCDVIFLEGFKGCAYPKYEIVRSARSTGTVCDPSTMLGIISDLPDLQPGIPHFDLNSLEGLFDHIEENIRRQEEI